MADGSLKRVNDVKNGEWVASIDGKTEEVCCDVDNEVEDYFVLQTKAGHQIEITGEHPMMTPDGWKTVKELSVGDSVMRMEVLGGTSTFDEITVLTIVKERRKMYNLICEDCAIIANGFVCSDFHMQYKLVVLSRL